MERRERVHDIGQREPCVCVCVYVCVCVCVFVCRLTQAIHWSLVRLVQPKAVLRPLISINKNCTTSVPKTMTTKKEFLNTPSKTLSSL